MMLSARRSTDRMVLADIFSPLLNYCGWQRELTPPLTTYLAQVISHPLRLTQVLAVSDAQAYFSRTLPHADGQQNFIDDLSEIMDMFTCLLDCEQVGLRMTVLDKAMCPKFHRDNLQVRLVTTYWGPGTEWLCEPIDDENNFSSAKTAEVALLKGEAWPNNEVKGVLHRSPMLAPEQRRLVVTMDPM